VLALDRRARALWDTVVSGGFVLLWQRRGGAEGEGTGGGVLECRIRTALPEAYFFSVATTPPLRCAALRADLPRMTLERGALEPPLTLLPILVMVFQSSDIVRERVGLS
jgi:hypothetical protein